MMEDCDQCKLAKSIGHDIYKVLTVCLGLTSRKLVMEKVLSIPNVNVATLALGSQPRQGLGRMRGKREA
jgi:hypothetical protein